MKKLLLMLFVTMSFLVQGQVPTDWQVDGLKGKVKKMTMVRTWTDGAIKKEEVLYNVVGVKTKTLLYDTDDSGSSLVCEYQNIYREYKDNKRYIISLPCEEEDNEYTMSNRTPDREYWTADRQQVFIYGFLGNDSYSRSTYDEEYRLINKESYTKFSSGGEERIVVSNVFYTYNEGGELIRLDYSSKSNNEEEKLYYLYETQKRDRRENILRRIVQGKEKKNSFTEEFTYEYY
ncbi:hypothetical protein HX052_07275 [Myroides marinus]|uniref:hypothetical protein n=1 Tax=Myroides marinus TaxID=703342 RepID=UPI002575AF38|nr:hypothetical protein [Myroides marinus]MDM1372108.1 hypothetical protein [Myroides marinus]MDM1389769.1 hypothetical protein [Myroides marinus]MDM1501670.1 hypothetical protein [Myroides marinus]